MRHTINTNHTKSWSRIMRQRKVYPGALKLPMAEGDPDIREIHLSFLVWAASLIYSMIHTTTELIPVHWLRAPLTLSGWHVEAFSWEHAIDTRTLVAELKAWKYLLQLFSRSGFPGWQELPKKQVVETWYIHRTQYSAEPEILRDDRQDPANASDLVEPVH